MDPPAVATLPDGEAIELVAAAEEVTRRYFAEFPDDLDNYSAEVRDWAVHDTQHILSWAVSELNGFRALGRQVDWLARVLAARDFPLERLARNLELSADVLAERVPGERDAIEAMFAEAARGVRAASA
jgi:hypothetical protein